MQMHHAIQRQLYDHINSQQLCGEDYPVPTMTMACCFLTIVCCPVLSVLHILQKMSGYIKYPFLTGPQHNGHPNADGALLVIPSRYVDLDEQVRTKDKFHASVVAKLQRRQGMTLSDL